MTECRKAKDRMIEALYGGLEPADKELFERHLRACPECAAEYSVLGATLAVMTRRKRPDPGPAFWDGYYGRLEKRLDAELASAPAVPARPSPGRRFAGLFSFAPRWAAQAAAAVVLVAAGVLIGRSVLTPPSPGPAAGGTAVAVSRAGRRPPARPRRELHRAEQGPAPGPGEFRPGRERFLRAGPSPPEGDLAGPRRRGRLPQGRSPEPGRPSPPRARLRPRGHPPPDRQPRERERPRERGARPARGGRARPAHENQPERHGARGPGREARPRRPGKKIHRLTRI